MEFQIENGVLMDISGPFEEVVRVPQGVTTIPDCCFSDNETFRQIILPDSVTEIGIDPNKKAQKRTNTAYLFVSHDMSVVRYMCDKVAVMYLGKILEYGTRKDIFEHPLHPYTKALLSAVPIPEVGRNHNRILLTGDVPSPLNPPVGCRFHNRCPNATPACATAACSLRTVSETHSVACPYAEELEAR